MSPHEFHFLRPLWLLALIPLMVVLWRLAAPRDDADSWQRVVDRHLLPHVLVGKKNAVRRWPLALLGLGWLMAVMALAGPAWERLPRPVYQAPAYRVLALDLSASMNATDLLPSRLTHARFKVLDILKRVQEGQTALLAYGAEPYVVSPLTTDVHTIEAQVPSLETELLPVQGPKNTALALRQAGELLHRVGAPTGEIILITDGLAQPAAAQEAAAALRQARYRVSVLGISTSAGAPIPLPDGGFLTAGNGSILLSKLDPAALQALATAGGGRYAQASLEDEDLQALMAGSPGLQGQFRQSDANSDAWREEGPWLLLALLPLAALGFRRGWLTVLIGLPLLAPPPAEAFSWSNLWLRPDQQAARAMERRAYEEATQRFERSDWRAAAEYAAGDYAQALQTLGPAGDATVHYNRGNALAKLGRFEQSIAEYDGALAANPDDEDARHNRELVRKLLRERQEAQQQNSQHRQQDSRQQGQEGEPETEQRGRGDNHPEQASAEDRHSGNAQQQGPAAPAARHQGAGTPSEEAPALQNTESPEAPLATGGAGVAGPTKPPTTSRQAQTDGQSQRSENRPANEAEPNLAQQDASQGRPPAPLEHEPGLADLLGGNPASSKPQRTASLESGADIETRQALEQMLRRVPDDPAGLLRQRFLLQHLRRAGRLP